MNFKGNPFKKMQNLENINEKVNKSKRSTVRFANKYVLSKIQTKNNSKKMKRSKARSHKRSTLRSAKPFGNNYLKHFNRQNYNKRKRQREEQEEQEREEQEEQEREEQERNKEIYRGLTGVGFSKSEQPNYNPYGSSF